MSVETLIKEEESGIDFPVSEIPIDANVKLMDSKQSETELPQLISKLSETEEYVDLALNRIVGTAQILQGQNYVEESVDISPDEVKKKLETLVKKYPLLTTLEKEKLWQEQERMESLESEKANTLLEKQEIEEALQKLNFGNLIVEIGNLSAINDLKKRRKSIEESVANLDYRIGNKKFSIDRAREKPVTSLKFFTESTEILQYVPAIVTKLEVERLELKGKESERSSKKEEIEKELEVLNSYRGVEKIPYLSKVKSLKREKKVVEKEIEDFEIAIRNKGRLRETLLKLESEVYEKQSSLLQVEIEETSKEVKEEYKRCAETILENGVLKKELREEYFEQYVKPFIDDLVVSLPELVQVPNAATLQKYKEILEVRIQNYLEKPVALDYWEFEEILLKNISQTSLRERYGSERAQAFVKWSDFFEVTNGVAKGKDLEIAENLLASMVVQKISGLDSSFRYYYIGRDEHSSPFFRARVDSIMYDGKDKFTEQMQSERSRNGIFMENLPEGATWNFIKKSETLQKLFDEIIQQKDVVYGEKVLSDVSRNLEKSADLDAGVLESLRHYPSTAAIEILFSTAFSDRREKRRAEQILLSLFGDKDWDPSFEEFHKAEPSFNLYPKLAAFFIKDLRGDIGITESELESFESLEPSPLTIKLLLLGVFSSELKNKQSQLILRNLLQKEEWKSSFTEFNTEYPAINLQSEDMMSPEEQLKFICEFLTNPNESSNSQIYVRENLLRRSEKFLSLIPSEGMKPYLSKFAEFLLEDLRNDMRIEDAWDNTTAIKILLLLPFSDKSQSKQARLILESLFQQEEWKQSFADFKKEYSHINFQSLERVSIDEQLNFRVEFLKNPSEHLDVKNLVRRIAPEYLKNFFLLVPSSEMNPHISKLIFLFANCSRKHINIDENILKSLETSEPSPIAIKLLLLAGCFNESEQGPVRLMLDSILQQEEWKSSLAEFNKEYPTINLRSEEILNLRSQLDLIFDCLTNPNGGFELVPKETIIRRQLELFLSSESPLEMNPHISKLIILFASCSRKNIRINESILESLQTFEPSPIAIKLLLLVGCFHEPEKGQVRLMLDSILQQEEWKSSLAEFNKEYPTINLESEEILDPSVQLDFIFECLTNPSDGFELVSKETIIRKQLELFLSSEYPLEMNSENWIPILTGYILSQSDFLGGSSGLSEESAKRIVAFFEDSNGANLSFRNCKELWNDYLETGRADSGSKLKFLSDYIDYCEGAGPLSQLETFLDFTGTVTNIMSKESKPSKTKREIKRGLLSLEDRFLKERWSNDDITSFYSVSQGILGVAPSLFTDFLGLFEKLNPKQMKLFAEEYYPFYLAKLALMEEKKAYVEKGVFQRADLVDLRKEIRSLKTGLEDDSSSLEREKEKLLGDIKSLFKNRFGVIKIPETLNLENIRSINNVALYLANLQDRDQEKQTLLGFYLALMVNGDWQKFKRGETLEAKDYITDDKAAFVSEILERRAQLNPLKAGVLGLSEEALPEFFRLLSEDTENFALGSLDTIDVKLSNMMLNLGDLKDLDLYTNVLDKERMSMLLKWGNKRLSEVVSKMYQGRELGGEEKEIKDEIAAIYNKLDIDLTPQKLNQHFQAELGPLAKVTKVLNIFEEHDLETKIVKLRESLKPTSEIIELFGKLGENFTSVSGAAPLPQDLSYLENLINKKEGVVIDEDAKKVLQGYIDNINNQLIVLEEFYNKIRNQFQDLGKIKHPALQAKFAEIQKILETQTQDKNILSGFTGNLDVVIENIRECLSCTKPGSNNDTNMTLGDINKYYLFSKIDVKGKETIADQLVFLQPVIRENGEEGVAFILDRLYGDRKAEILKNQISVVLKKYVAIKQQFPEVKLSVFIPTSTISSGGISLEILMDSLRDKGVQLKQEKIKVDFVKSALGEHYVEFGGMLGRVTGLIETEGLLVSI